jgi:hypothetical protein
MSVSLSAVWSQVEKLILDGISVIPVRDKDDETSGRPAKTPFGSWKKYQDKAIDKSELWALMEHYGTEAVGIVCGKVSGNLEAIDIDVKYKTGIDAILFQDIKTIYPELFTKLRIHKTPSGGWHILYRVADGTIPGNLKLAGREASDAELESHPKNKTYNFIETRGEGGYILCPPSLGYTISKDCDIPVLTWEERCSLIALCETYNEIIKVAPTYKPTKAESEYYTENPWDHFNGSCNPVEFFKGFGWEEFKRNNHFIWFTRPGKNKGVSASWNLTKRIFYIFTSSSELEASKGYHPVTILSILKFGGDKKQTYQYLVSNGYGKVKPTIERAIIKKSALAGATIPANFSDQAKAEFQQIKNNLAEDHPYGIFIKFDPETEKLGVSYESLLCVASNLGLRTFGDDVVLITGHIIEKITNRKMQDILKDYIIDEDPDEYEKLCNVFERFVRDNTKFISQRLPLLDETMIIKDTRDECFKFYKNGYLLITKDSIDFHTYDLFDRYVWSDRVQPRDYGFVSGGRFVEYLELALNKPVDAKKVLGYLSHEFKDETMGYIIVLSETCSDPKDGGGSGKNVFCNLLKLTTSYISKPGAQAKFDEKFFQVWNGQKIFGISDVDKDFKFSFLKEPATGSFVWKRLWSNEVSLEAGAGPKFIIQTNYSYDVSDGGLARRIIPLEFTDYFTKCGGLDVHFGVHFPNGWSEDDFSGYDNYIAECVQEWLKAGCKLSSSELTETGWVKQWEQSFGNATGFITDNWDIWMKNGYVTNDAFKKLMEDYYNANNVIKTYWPSPQKMNKAITAYAERHKINYISDKNARFQNGQFKCRLFGNIDISSITLDDLEKPF